MAGMFCFSLGRSKKGGGINCPLLRVPLAPLSTQTGHNLAAGPPEVSAKNSKNFV